MADQIIDALDIKAKSPPSPGQKRKRAPGEMSPDDRRTKRGAPSFAATAAAAIAATHTNSTFAYMGDAVEAAAVSGVNVDLSALQQATNEDHHSEAADPANASSTAAAALGTMYPTLHVPSSTEQQFAQAASDTQSSQDHHYTSPEISHSEPTGHGNPGMMIPPTGPSQLPPTNGARMQSDYQQHRKPPVGSDEWHKLRKNNHKEVERRRRETINEGINELAKIVPGCEKNKGSILQKAVQFIITLKQNETSNIEKWTLEKLLTEQAIGELSQSNEKLKAECERLYRELETYKRVCQSAGLEVPGKADGQTPQTTTSSS